MGFASHYPSNALNVFAKTAEQRFEMAAYYRRAELIAEHWA